MVSKHLLLALIAMSKVLIVAMSQGLDLGAILQAAGGGGSDSGAIPSCFQKLLPCQAYLKSPDSPPESCCTPLKDMISGDMDCLCQVFNNPDLLKNLNVTQDQALKLPKACGAQADISICKKGSPGGSPGAPTTPSTPADADKSNSSSTPNVSKSNSTSAANGMSNFGGSGLAVCFVSLIMSAL
nr:non-specific lipid transfer protein GPI-anchored 3-like isoform X2 [Ziziphus jujuba var. spinosa]